MLQMVLLEALTSLWLPTPPPPTHPPLIRPIRAITAVMKKVAHNSAVLAS